MARVLVVDDDAEIRATMRVLLEDAGHEVAEAENGQSCLTVLRSMPEPLVVLLDYLMPGMNGGEVLRAAVAEGLETRHAWALVVATPRVLDLDLRERARTRGIPIVTKPFDIDALLTVVMDRAARLARG